MKHYGKLLLLLIAFATQNIVAQTLTGDMIASQLKAKASILNDCQNMLVDKEKSLEVKSYYKKQALCLFVNNGNPFMIDSLSYSGSTITTSSIYRSKPVTRKVTDYLQGLIEMRFVPIDLNGLKIPAFPSVINEADFVKYGENQYKYTFIVTRELAGYIDNTPVYKDITPYEYTIFLSLQKTILGTEYTVYLNDLVIENKAEDGK
jgi:hypothetical protein